MVFRLLCQDECVQSSEFVTYIKLFIDHLPLKYWHPTAFLPLRDETIIK